MFRRFLITCVLGVGLFIAIAWSMGLLHVSAQDGSQETVKPAAATANTTSVGPGLYAVVTYPVHLTGGTGKFARVTGDFNNIGEVDLNSGQLVLRYSGQLCSPDRD